MNVQKTDILKKIEEFINYPNDKQIDGLTKIFKEHIASFAPSDVNLLEQAKIAVKPIDKKLSKKIDKLIQTLKEPHFPIEDEVPLEILYHMKSFLPIKDQAQFSLVCKKFAKVRATDEMLNKYANYLIKSLDKEKLFAFLDIEGRKITELNLEYLEVSNEELKKIITLCPELKALTVQDNGIGEGISDYGLMNLKNLPHLEFLRLDNCRLITNDGLAHLKYLKSLKSLSIIKNYQISNSGLKQLSNLSLKHLYLNGCYISSIGNLTSSQSSLEHLTLDDCDMSNLKGIKKIGNFTALRSLEIMYHRRMWMSEDGCTQFRKLLLLENLNFTSCDITDFVIEMISVLPSIRSLNISDCKELTDASLNSLAKAKETLQYLNISNCDRMTEDGMKRIRKEIPELKIIL